MHALACGARPAGRFSRQVLEALPAWFGIPSAVDEYVAFVGRAPTWLATVDGARAGFLSVRRHYAHSAEIEVMAVLPEWHRRGIGRCLVTEAARDLSSDGVRFLQVKTLDASRESSAYAATRRFYESLSFERIQVFPRLWGESNPALQLIRFIG